MSEDLKKSIKEKFEADLKAKERVKELNITNSQVFEEEISKKELFYKERDQFFQDKEGYTKIINNIGEEEWISEDELKKRDGYLNFEEDMDDAIVHQRRLLKRYLFISFMMIFISIFGIYYLVENRGFIEVESNKTGIKIFLDNELIGLTTGETTTIEQVVTGKHVVRLEKLGFKITPDSLILDVVKSDPEYPTATVATFKVDSIITTESVIDKSNK